MTQLVAEHLDSTVPSTGGGRRSLVSDLSLVCEPATLTAVVGPNGAGKTTLLRDLVGVTVPHAGVVRLGDRPIQQWSMQARARTLAYLPQGWAVPYDLRVDEIVMLGRTPHQRWYAAPSVSDREVVAGALRFVDAESLAARTLSTLSGGERQRVRLARMLATEASVLVLDEPTTALDVGHALRLLGLLRALADRGTTVVAALHDLDLARRHADRVLLLEADDAGSHRQGPPDTLLVPGVLDPVFGVHTTITDEGLYFRARDEPGGG